jgi:hypothetical protein
LIVKVSDNGVGISRENLGKVFDPFYSTKGVWGKDEVVGTGMGLSVSRNIARDHGGDLTVESEPGKGSTFILTLPVALEGSDHSRLKTEPEITNSDCKSIALITLEKNLAERYSQEASQLDCTVILADSDNALNVLIKKKLNLAVADAHFAAKVALFQMLENCRKHHIPFIMVNCGAMEYQLNELYNSALAVYRDSPGLNQILMQFRSAAALQNELR